MTDEHIKRCSMRCIELAEDLGVGDPNARAMIDLVLHIQDQRALLAKLEAVAQAAERIVLAFNMDTRKPLLDALAALKEDK